MCSAWTSGYFTTESSGKPRTQSWAPQVAQRYRISLPMQETTKDKGLTPGMGRSPGVQNGNPNSSILGASQIAQMVKNQQRV